MYDLPFLVFAGIELWKWLPKHHASVCRDVDRFDHNVLFEGALVGQGGAFTKWVTKN